MCSLRTHKRPPSQARREGNKIRLRWDQRQDQGALRCSPTSRSSGETSTLFNSAKLPFKERGVPTTSQLATDHLHTRDQGWEPEQFKSVVQWDPTLPHPDRAPETVPHSAVVPTTAVPTPPQDPRRSARDWTPSTRALENVVSGLTHDDFDQSYTFLFACDTTATLPRSVTVAKMDPNWRAGFYSEKNAHFKNGTLGPPQRLPPGYKSIPTAIIYKIKTDEHGVPAIWKCRLVLRGYLMVSGIDYNETYAPTSRLTSLRMLMAVACNNAWSAYQCDIETAFLNPVMDAKVYITLPKGYSPEEDELPYKPVHLLLKGLPGAPQSSRLFYNLMHTVLTNAGYERLQPDHCLYIIKGKALLLLWVDDFVNAVAHQAIHIELLKRLEQASLTVKNLGEVRTFLGARFQRDISGKKLTIDQEEPIRRLVERAGLADAKPASTPCARNQVHQERLPT